MKQTKGLKGTTISKKGRAESGITLIALVITIILLMILAGVSIATLSGENGILGRAADAKIRTQREADMEQIKLAYSAAIIDNYNSNTTYSSKEGVTATQLGKQLPKGATAQADTTDAKIIIVTFTYDDNSTSKYQLNGTTGDVTVVAEDTNTTNTSNTTNTAL